MLPKILVISLVFCMTSISLNPQICQSDPQVHDVVKIGVHYIITLFFPQWKPPEESRVKLDHRSRGIATVLPVVSERDFENLTSTKRLAYGVMTSLHCKAFLEM